VLSLLGLGMGDISAVFMWEGNFALCFISVIVSSLELTSNDSSVTT